jgi:hypothetical protein
LPLELNLVLSAEPEPVSAWMTSPIDVRHQPFGFGGLDARAGDFDAVEGFHLFGRGVLRGDGKRQRGEQQRAADRHAQAGDSEGVHGSPQGLVEPGPCPQCAGWDQM